jgi:parvulin-like peptidyl-prolyl isomerase
MPVRACLAALFLCAAVGAQDAETRPGEAPKPDAVASVNGKVLTEAEFGRRCARFVGGAPDTAVGLLALKEWIQHTLAEEEATRRSMLPKPGDIERRILALRKQWEFRGENFDTWLTERGRTPDTLREEIRGQLIAESLLTEGVSVSDVEVATYYAGNKDQLGLPERLRVSRITTNDRNTVREIEAALKRGEAFADVARKRSLDPYKNAGGAVSELVATDPSAEGPLEKPVLERAVKLAPGKYAGPIKVEDYWVFVLVHEKLPAKAPELSDIRDLLVANLKVQKGGAERLRAAQARMTQLQRDANVEVFRPELRHVLTQLQGGQP